MGVAGAECRDDIVGGQQQAHGSEGDGGVGTDVVPALVAQPPQRTYAQEGQQLYAACQGQRCSVGIAVVIGEGDYADEKGFCASVPQSCSGLAPSEIAAPGVIATEWLW